MMHNPILDMLRSLHHRWHLVQTLLNALHWFQDLVQVEGIFTLECDLSYNSKQSYTHQSSIKYITIFIRASFNNLREKWMTKFRVTESYMYMLMIKAGHQSKLNWHLTSQASFDQTNYTLSMGIKSINLQ